MRKRSHRVDRAIFATIESLEGRRLLSTVTLVPNGDGSNTLKIVGTDGKDTVTVYDNPQANSVEVIDDKNHNTIVEAGEFHAFSAANLHNVDANMKKGDDTVEIEPVSTYIGSERSFDIDLKEGNDHFTFDSPTVPDVGTVVGTGVVDPNGADIVNHSDISFTVEGESGNDHIRFDLSRTSILTSAVSINVDTEEGKDTVDLLTPDFTLGEEGVIGGTEIAAPNEEVSPAALDSIIGPTPSELQVEVDLGSDNDTMNQTIHSEIRSSDVNINVRGEGGKDVYHDNEGFGLFGSSIFAQPQLDGTVAGLDGSSLTVNADLGSGDDKYDGIYNFSRTSGGVVGPVVEPAITPITVFPGIAIDELSDAHFNVQGGTGNDRLTIDDGTFSFSIAPDVVEPAGPAVPILQPSFIDGLMDMQFHGGFGNDLVRIDVDPGALINVGPAGTLRGIISGDDGADRCLLDIRISAASSGQYDFAVLGGGDNDVLGAAFQNDALGENTPDHYGPRGHILVDGGRGTDRWDTEGNGLFRLRGVEVFDDGIEAPFA